MKDARFKHAHMTVLATKTIYLKQYFPLDHFTVVCLNTWSLNESEAGVDLALIQTSAFLMLMMLFSC